MSAMGKIANPDVFELHIAAAAGMQLQCNGAIGSARTRVSKIDHLHSIEAGTIAVPRNFDQIIVPIAHANDAFIFGGRPNDPMAVGFGIDAAGVVHHGAVDFKLHALRDVRGTWRECGMKEYAAVPVAYTFEPERELEILVGLFGLKITVILRHALCRE